MTEGNERFQVVDGRKYPWFRIRNEIIDVYGAEMGPHGLAIYCALSRHANQKGECWPSYALLAEETGMSRPTAIKGTERIIGLKLLEKQVRQYAKEGPRSNLYILIDPPSLIDRHGKGDLPGVVKEVDKHGKGDSPGMVNGVDRNNTNMNKTHGKPSTKASRAIKRKVLRDFGVRGSIVTEIARDHDMPWIRKAMEEMGNPTPASIVYLHRQGWEPPTEEEEIEDTFCLFCSVCGELDGACKCPDPKPEQVSGPEFERLLESRREHEHVGGSNEKGTA